MCFPPPASSLTGRATSRCGIGPAIKRCCCRCGCCCCCCWSRPLIDDAIIVVCLEDAVGGAPEEAPLESMLTFPAPPTTPRPASCEESLLLLPRAWWVIDDGGIFNEGKGFPPLSEESPLLPPPSETAVSTAVFWKDGISMGVFLGFRPKVN